MWLFNVFLLQLNHKKYFGLVVSLNFLKMEKKRRKKLKIYGNQSLTKQR